MALHIVSWDKDGVMRDAPYTGNHNAAGEPVSVTDKQIRKFKKLCAELNTLIIEIRKTEPEAELYLQEDSFHILSGESHTGVGVHGGSAEPGRSIVSVFMRHTGGGAW